MRLPVSRAAPGIQARIHLPLPRKLLVFDALRNNRLDAQPAHLVLLVVLVIAFEPLDTAVALESENVGGDAVEKPAVVADDDGAAGKILERLFQRAQRVDVGIVGLLVVPSVSAASVQ